MALPACLTASPFSLMRSSPDTIVAGVSPSWHVLSRRSRPIHLKIFNKFILTGQTDWSRTGERNTRLCFRFLTGWGQQEPGFFHLHPLDVLLLTVFFPFPSGGGSVLLVPAEGFHLLHAVCGRTHRGKCVGDSLPEFPYRELPNILPTTRDYVRLLCMVT